MAMTGREATAVNVVMRWLLALPGPAGLPVSAEEAQRAAAGLADRARSHLGAGLSGDDVRGHWPARAVPAVSASARLYQTPGTRTGLLAEPVPGTEALMRARVVVPLPHGDDAGRGPAPGADLDLYAVGALLGDWRSWVAEVVGGGDRPV